jgi:hypothetical protein
MGWRAKVASLRLFDIDRLREAAIRIAIDFVCVVIAFSGHLIMMDVAVKRVKRPKGH